MAFQITGWKLDHADRDRLLARFAPRYTRTVADHVTLMTGPGGKLPVRDSGEVIGVADDGAGVQALVVRIGGTTARGDGSHYHITWSLADGRKAKESNDVIRSHGWADVEPTAIRLIPARWNG